MLFLRQVYYLFNYAPKTKNSTEKKYSHFEVFSELYSRWCGSYNLHQIEKNENNNCCKHKKDLDLSQVTTIQGFNAFLHPHQIALNSLHKNCSSPTDGKAQSSCVSRIPRNVIQNPPANYIGSWTYRHVRHVRQQNPGYHWRKLSFSKLVSIHVMMQNSQLAGEISWRESGEIPWLVWGKFRFDLKTSLPLPKLELLAPEVSFLDLRTSRHSLIPPWR